MSALPLHPPDDSRALDAYSNAVVSVVERVGPAVVSLSVPRRRMQGAGSGFLVAPDGLLLTNSHVVHGTSRMQARLRDGRELGADTIGDDPASDVALVRLRASALPHVEVDERVEPVPGQLAIAIGNPLGFDATVSAGVVSAVGRSLMNGSGAMEGLVQHTAPLNPGSSGGPLLDSQGRLLGVNTAVIPRSQGIGFAIGVEAAAFVIGELLAHGRVRRVVLGIAGLTRPLSGPLRELDGDRSTSAVEVREIARGSPAEQSGLRVGDLVVRLDDRAVPSVSALSRALSRAGAGKPVALAVVRGDRLIAIEARPSER